MTTKRTEEEQQPTPAEQARAAAAEALRQWATYWRNSAVLAWRVVAPARKDTHQ